MFLFYKIVLRLFILLLLFCHTTENLFAQTIRFQNSLRGGLGVATNGFNLDGQTTFVNTAGGVQMSSSSDLILPPGSQIVKAILYVEGYSAAINTVKFSYPGSGGLIGLDNNTPGFIGNPSTGSYSQFIVDVTNIIPSNGYTTNVVAGGDASMVGRYACADVAPYDASNYGYGWSMMVVYINPNSRYRNVTIADQNVTYGLGSSSTINVPNIIVPAIGPINAIVVATGCWGDPGALYRDNIRFGVAGNQVALNDPVTGANNDVLNGTIGFSVPNNVTDDGIVGMVGGNYVGRNPYNGFGGTQGSAMYYDCDLMDASGILAPDPNPVQLAITQAGQGSDALGVGTYAVSVDIAAAVLTKSINPTAIPSGGVATYTFTIDNNLPGAIDLTGISFDDNIPPSLEIANPNCVSITGGTGGNVTAVPGTNAFSLTNLDLLAGQVCTITLCVTNKPGQLNPDCSNSPPGFTNGFSNIQNNSENLANAVTDQCLVILGAPVAGFEADSVCIGNATSFTDTTQVVPGDPIASWEWDFGVTPAATSTVQNPTYTYDSPGDYTVTLIVESTNGERDTVSGSVHVKSIPAVTLSAVPTAICLGDSAQLTATGGDVYQWTGSGLSSTTIANPKASPTSTTTYNIKVISSATGCEKDTTLELIVNPLPTAGIDGNLEICSGVSTTLTGTGGVSYQWPLGGQTTPSITVSPTSNTVYAVIVTDANGCRDTTTETVLIATPPDVGPDFVGELCNSIEQYDLHGFLNPTDHTSLDGEWVDISAGTQTTTIDLETGEMQPNAEAPGIYTIAYYYDAENGCPIDTALLELTIIDTPTVVFDPIVSVCEGSDFVVGYTVSGTSSAYDVHFTTNTVLDSKTGITPMVAQSFLVTGSSDLDITLDSIVSNDAPNCSSRISQNQNLPLIIPPDVDTASVVCNGTNTGIIVTLIYAQGDPSTYELIVDNDPPIPAPASGVLNLSMGQHIIRLTDVNNCTPYDSIVFTHGCNCQTFPGGMTESITDTIEVCGTGRVKVNHNGDELYDGQPYNNYSGNDVASYVLHTGSGTSPGAIIQQQHDSASFAFISGMELDKVYYISLMIGDSLDYTDPNTFPDESAGCTKTSPGVPVVWHEIPAGSVMLDDNEICESNPSNLKFTFTAGVEDYSVVYDKDGIPQPTVTGLNTTKDSIYVGEQPNGTYVYDNFRFTDGNGCTFNIASPSNTSLTVNDSVQALWTDTICAADNETYTAVFQVSDGTGNYTVEYDGVTQPLTGATFSHSGITSGQPFIANFYDDKGCNVVTLTANKSCPCDTRPPTMVETDTLEFCFDDPAVVPVDVSTYLADGNDAYSFIMCTDTSDVNGTAISGTLLSATTSPSYTRASLVGAGVTTNTVYYVVALAGNATTSNANLVDTNITNCHGIKTATPILWMDVPTIALSAVESELCFGEPGQVEVVINSVKPTDFQLGIAGNRTFDTEYTSVTNGTVTYTLPTERDTLPNQNSAETFVYSVKPMGTPPTPVSFTYTNVDGVTHTCPGQWDNSTADYNIHPIPTAEFISSGNCMDCQVCEGQELLGREVRFTGTGQMRVHGDAPFTTLQPSGTNLLGVRDITANLLLPDTTTAFSLDSVFIEITLSAGGTKTCRGYIEEDSVLRVTNIAHPDLAASVSTDAFCIGGELDLYLQESGDAEGIYTVTAAGGEEFHLPAEKVTRYSPLDDTTFVFIQIVDNTSSNGTGHEGEACVTVFEEPREIPVTVYYPPTVSIEDDKEEKCAGEGHKIYLNGTDDNDTVFFLVNEFIRGSYNATIADTLVVSEGSQIEVPVRPSDSAYYVIAQATDDFGCVAVLEADTAYLHINPIPEPIILSSLDASCPPLVTTISNGTRADHSGQCTWDYGNGLISNRCEAQELTFTEAGTYTIRLEVTTPQNCWNFTTKEVTVHPFPIADFKVDGKPTIIESDIKVRDQSSLAVSHYYTTTFGKETDDAEPRFQLPYQDTGTYYITQVVETQFGCMDTITKRVFVQNEMAVYIPKAFTPNGDDVNDMFGPEVLGDTPEFFEFRVFDRWGREIFYTNNSNHMWDGMYNGLMSQQGVYSYRVKVKRAHDAQRQDFVGWFSLLK